MLIIFEKDAIFSHLSSWAIPTVRRVITYLQTKIWNLIYYTKYGHLSSPGCGCETREVVAAATTVCGAGGKEFTIHPARALG